ncbi:nucleoside deaminase [bacterium]|jgi:tRNA(adenine34) deaminase|nr:nucleoside deaminase [bacterium]
MTLIKPDYMAEALKEAVKAFDKGEVPVGAVIINRYGSLIARAHNQSETLKDATAHAEMIAITQASNAIGGWRLADCTMYATKEPCTMCAGAIFLSRIKKVVYGCPEKRCGGLVQLIKTGKFPEIEASLEIEFQENRACAEILEEFFEKLRKK